MSVPVLNNAVTTDIYQEVIFTFPKNGFALNVTNAAVFYQVGIPGASGSASDVVWDTLDHYVAPSMTNFVDPAQEGFQGTTKFAGVRVKSAVAGTPARVTVI